MAIDSDDQQQHLTGYRANLEGAQGGSDKVINTAVAAVGQDDVNAIRMNDDVHDETTTLIDIVVMAAMNIAAKTEADEASALFRPTRMIQWFQTTRE